MLRWLSLLITATLLVVVIGASGFASAAQITFYSLCVLFVVTLIKGLAARERSSGH